MEKTLKMREWRRIVGLQKQMPWLMREGKGSRRGYNLSAFVGEYVNSENSTIWRRLVQF